MKYLTTYYWQQEETSATSLVLQQFVFRKDGQHGIFACICTARVWEEDEERACAEKNYFAKQLTDWFQREGRKLFYEDNSEEFVRTKKKMERVIARTDSEMAKYAAHRTSDYEPPHFIILLGVGGRFLLFCRGAQKAYLLNRRFEHVHCKCLTEQEKREDLQIISGEMECGIGLLLATEDFVERVTAQQLKECLSVKELARTANRKGRLRELGEEAARQGGRHMGAILLLTDVGKE